MSTLIEEFGDPPHTDGQIEIAVAEAFFDDDSGLPPPCLRTMRRWIDTQSDVDFKTAAPPSVFLANASRQQGARAAAFPPAVERMISDVIDEELLRRAPTSVMDAYATLVGRIDAENRIAPWIHLPKPSYETIWRRWNAIDPALRMHHQLGPRAVRRTFGPVGGPREVQWPNEVVETDHNWIACNLVDEDGIVLGPAILTLSIDIYTSMPTGFALAFEPPSYVSNMLCVRHTVKPKAYLSTAFKGRINADWPCAGLPETLIVDNGSDFHSGSFKAALASQGVTVIWAERASPWQRGHVERAFLTVGEILTKHLPGAKLSGRKLPDDYDATTAATVTLTALNELLHMLFADVFPAMPWPWDKTKTRRQAWEARVSKFPLRLPRSLKEFEIFTLAREPAPRCLRPTGVEVFGMYYDSHELTKLRDDGVAKGWIYYDATDLSRVVVCPIDDKVRWVYADCKSGKYAKKRTLWQHRRILDHLDPDQRRRANQDDLIAARIRLKERAEQVVGKKRRRRRNAKDHTRHTHRAVTPDVLADGETQSFDEMFERTDAVDTNDDEVVPDGGNYAAVDNAPDVSSAALDDREVGDSGLASMDDPTAEDPEQPIEGATTSTSDFAKGCSAVDDVDEVDEDDDASVASLAAEFIARR